MPAAGILLSTLALPVGKFLLKKYLELPEPADAIADELLKLAGKKITDPFEKEDAKQEFEKLASNVVRQLVPLFEGMSDDKTELICAEMQATLSGNLDAEFFLKRDLDPARLTQAFKEARPLPAGQLDPSETALYERVLTETVRYLVASAAMLPKFEQGFAAVSLQRLSAIHGDIREELRRVKHIETMLAGGDKESRFEADYPHPERSHHQLGRNRVAVAARRTGGAFWHR